MTTKRLEELAQWAESNAADAERRMHAAGASGEWITGGTEVHREELRYFADLARCARAWVNLERWVKEHEQVAELYGYRGRDLPWSFYPNSSAISTRFTGATAIEAVEAAEVGK